MTGEITKIDPWKKTSDGRSVYRRVYFNLDDGKFAWTNIVFGFRNYHRWAKVMRVGNKLFNLRLLDDMTVDADSYPHLLDGRKINKFILPKTTEEWCKAGLI
jgi:hypothetical protein